LGTPGKEKYYSTRNKREVVMKLNTTIFLTFLLSLISCSMLGNDWNKSTIVGEWEWLKSTVVSPGTQ